LRSNAHTFIDYSRVHSLADFFSVFLRTQYSGDTIRSIKGVSYLGMTWLYSIRNVGLILSKEIHPIIWVFIVSGIVHIFKEKKTFGYILVSVLLWIPLAEMTIVAKEPTSVDFTVVSPYFLQLILILGIVAATGLYKCYEVIKTRSSVIANTIVTGLIIFQMVNVFIAFQKASLSDYSVAYNWIKDVSKVMKPKSFFLAFGDNPGFLSFYGFGVERLRDDVVSLDTAPGDNTFRLTIAPEKTFSVWYPEFYATQGTSIKYFYPIAEEGRLYSSMIGSIPQSIMKNFDIRWYVLVSIFMPKEKSFPFQERFKEDFEKIDYLPVLWGSNKDFMTEEILKGYVFTVWEYANLLTDENTTETDYFYNLAIFMTSGQLNYEIMKTYVQFLADKRGNRAAENLITELKNVDYTSVEKLEEWYRVQNTIKK
jgi:hypothetical protein